MLALTEVDADASRRWSRRRPSCAAAALPRPGAVSRGARRARSAHRAALAGAFGLDPQRPWLLAVAMMRADVKRDSYRLLAAALGRLRAPRLAAAGGRRRPGARRGRGGARSARRGAGRASPARCRKTALPACYAAADLYVWPAVREAYGMAMLEAQAAGLPVVAGREGGVAEVVADGVTGAADRRRAIRAPSPRRSSAARRCRSGAAHGRGGGALRR